MNKVKFISILFLSFLLQSSYTGLSYGDKSSAEICMYLFYEQGCENCKYIIDEFLKGMFDRYQDRLKIRYFELSNHRNYELLVKLEDMYNKSDNEFPIIVIGDYILGFKEIEAKLDVILDHYSTTGVSFQREELLKGARFTEEPVWIGGVEEEERSDKYEYPEVYLAYLSEPLCKKCERTESQLRYLEWKYPNLVVKKFNLSGSEEKKLAEALGAIYNVPENRRMATPSVFIGDDYLITDEINDKSLGQLIEKYIYEGTTPPWEKAEHYLQQAERNIIERFKGLEITTVFFAGLIDGINPCAFVTIIFFVSYLALVGRRGRALLLAGIAFTSGVFVTYLLIGLGLLRFLESLAFVPIVARVVYILTAGGLIVLGCLSIYDYSRFERGIYDGSVLRLPNLFQRRIRHVVRERNKMTNYILAAFVTGFFISILEFACTGQVYLPIIVFVTKVPSLKARAILYLIVYNLFFIIPLIVVFLLAYQGFTSERLASLWKHRGKIVKLLLAVIFFILAGILIFYIV